jgi:DNA-binding XRE family transcriptional regulator
MSVQLIKKDGKPEWAVIPYADYQRLLEAVEILQDIRDYDEAKKAIEGGEELVPSELVYAILDGENPIRVWREYRGLTQQQLADAAGVSTPYLSQIESGKRKGTTKVLSAIAKVLGLALDDIVVSERTLE